MNLNNFNINKMEGLTLLKGGRVYDPFIKVDENFDILLDNGIIIDISKNINSAKGYNVIDCNGAGSPLYLTTT